MVPDNIFSFPQSSSRVLFNRERLREARLAARLSQTDLAKRINVSVETVSNLESGDRQPGAETLAHLCSELGYPPAFFKMDYPSGGHLEGAIFFRSHASKSKGQNYCLDEWRKRAGRLCAIITRFINLPRVNLPVANWASSTSEQELFENAEQLAQDCRRLWGIGNGPIANLTRLAESMGVYVIRLELPDMEDVDGFSCWQDGHPFIFLIAKESSTRERINLAHELLHLIAHRQVPEEALFDKESMKHFEKQAFAFAGAFLLPRVSYSRDIFSFNLSHFTELKRRWGVSIAAQGSRCRDIGVFDEDRYLQFRKNLSWNKYLKQEPLDKILPTEEPLMLRQAIEMLASHNLLTGWQIADELALPPNVLRQLTNLNDSEFSRPETPPPLSFSLLRTQGTN